MSQKTKIPVKDFFKNIEKKSEEQKMRIVWFWVIFLMLGIFSLWLVTVSRNFSKSGIDRMDFSQLPQFPQGKDIDLEKALKDGRDAISDYAIQNNLKLRESGDKYIKDKKILDDGFSSLRLADIEDGAGLINYEHYYKDIPVLGSRLILSVNLRTGEVSEKENNLKKEINVATDPVISAKDASKIAEKEIKDGSFVFNEAKLAVVQEDGKFYLVWKTVFKSEKGDSREVLVGAKYGSVIQGAQETNQTSNIAE